LSTRPWGPPSLLCNGYRFYSRGVNNGWGVTLTPHPLLVPWSRKCRLIFYSPYGPYSVYRASVPVQYSYTSTPLWAVRPVQSLSACTVQLYLYYPYGPYSLYRASVPVHYSYTSTPPMGRTAFTEPQCLYNTAIPVLPFWAVRPVKSLSACTV